MVINLEAWESDHKNKLKLSLTWPYIPTSRFTPIVALQSFQYVLARFCCSFDRTSHPLPYAILGYAKIKLITGKEAMGGNEQKSEGGDFSERYLFRGDISR